MIYGPNIFKHDIPNILFMFYTADHLFTIFLQTTFQIISCYIFIVILSKSAYECQSTGCITGKTYIFYRNEQHFQEVMSFLAVLWTKYFILQPLCHGVCFLRNMELRVTNQTLLNQRYSNQFDIFQFTSLCFINLVLGRLNWENRILFLISVFWGGWGGMC